MNENEKPVFAQYVVCEQVTRYVCSFDEAYEKLGYFLKERSINSFEEFLKQLPAIYDDVVAELDGNMSMDDFNISDPTEYSDFSIERKKNTRWTKQMGDISIEEAIKWFQEKSS